MDGVTPASQGHSHGISIMWSDWHDRTSPWRANGCIREMVLCDCSMRLRGGKMMNKDAAKKTEKRKRTIRQAGGVTKVARRRGSRLGKPRTGKPHRNGYDNRGPDDPAPRIVALIPASRSASSDVAFNHIVESCRMLGGAHSLPPPRPAAGTSSVLHSRPVTLRLPASCGGAGGGRVTLLRVDTTKTSSLLDSLKVADCAVLLHHGAELPAPSCSISSPVEMLEHADKRGVR